LKSKSLKNAIVVMMVMALMGSLAVGCNSGTTSTTDQSKVTIKFGFLGALTGSVANYGIPGKKGMEMAIDELNAKGGILGHKVEGIYEDNRGDTTEIANIATKYITQDKVNAMVGDPCTGLTKVAAEIAQKNKTVIFSAGATGEGVVEIGDFVFRNTLLDKKAVPEVVKWMINTKKWTKMAIVTSQNNGYSTALTPVFEQAIKANNATIVLQESINDGETDFSAQVTNLKAAQADVLVFTGYYTEAALFMKECQKQNVSISLIGGDGLYGQDLIKLGGDAVEGKVIYYCGFTTDQPSKETEAFITAYKAKYNEEPDMFAAQYYDAVMILAKAMTEANSTDPAVYKDKLAALKDYPGVSGKTSFGSDREPMKSPICLITIKNGKFALLEKIEVK